MRLRRGLQYAAIHAAITVALLYWQEAAFWESIPATPTAQRAAPREVTPSVATADTPAENEDKTPPDPCEAASVSDRPTSSQEKILAIDNLPIALLTGWHLPCSQPSRLDKLIQARYGLTQKGERVTGGLISVLALVLWFFVGSFPLIRRQYRRWYTEPSLFMTLGSLVSILLLGIGWALSRIPGDLPANIAEIVIPGAALPMIFVAAGWVWWAGLFCYVRWKATRHRIERGHLVAE
jgi:hypothetical protein